MSPTTTSSFITEKLNKSSIPVMVETTPLGLLLQGVQSVTPSDCIN